ncbi:(2Fe-2S)-binding protein [Bradyrhizobium sp. CCBAU 51745]|uniref:(2Fe-2S)-binding protein n=1 Tax=Bradyrhizobium sp. CCBAU 51745 TaxID=1325099 RepID=UPI003FA406C0
MIVCSCNVISDSQVKSTIANVKPSRPKHVYEFLCCTAKCGRCSRTIQAILESNIAAMRTDKTENSALAFSS